MLATLLPDASVVTHATRAALLVLGTGDELMEPKNPADFQPRRV